MGCFSKTNFFQVSAAMMTSVSVISIVGVFALIAKCKRVGKRTDCVFLIINPSKDEITANVRIAELISRGAGAFMFLPVIASTGFCSQEKCQRNQTSPIIKACNPLLILLVALCK